MRVDRAAALASGLPYFSSLKEEEEEEEERNSFGCTCFVLYCGRRSAYLLQRQKGVVQYKAAVAFGPSVRRTSDGRPKVKSRLLIVEPAANEQQRGGNLRITRI